MNAPLITSSLGLIHNKGKYYIQIITAENQNNYLIQITSTDAREISETEDIYIDYFTEIDPEDILLNPTEIKDLS